MSQNSVRPTTRMSNKARIDATVAAIVLSGYHASCSAAQEAPTAQPPGTEQWGIFEVVLKGPVTGNPFVDKKLLATFAHGGNKQTVTGFYDGDGTYRVRFMPDKVGAWQYTTSSNVAELDGKTGEFNVVAPTGSNHGPVHVRNTYHLAYADGTPHKPIGTPIYARPSQ